RWVACSAGALGTVTNARGCARRFASGAPRRFAVASSGSAVRAGPHPPSPPLPDGRPPDLFLIAHCGGVLIGCRTYELHAHRLACLAGCTPPPPVDFASERPLEARGKRPMTSKSQRIRAEASTPVAPRRRLLHMSKSRAAPASPLPVDPVAAA